ncbi:MAG: hypothetical protein V7700_18365 [Halioglobus sp.]
MKKLIIVLGLALASGAALAQPAGGPPGAEKAARMHEALGLSEDQIQQMREIREGGGTREEMRAILTPEQQVKAEQLKKERHGSREDRAARMQQHLGLSDTQVAEIREIREAGGSREDIRAVLTPEQQTQFDEARSKHKGKKSRTQQ